MEIVEQKNARKLFENLKNDLQVTFNDVDVTLKRPWHDFWRFSSICRSLLNLSVTLNNLV